MAKVLAVLTSGRRGGFTEQLLTAAIEGAQSVDNVDVEFLHTHDYQFGPCRSCFACIRDPEHVCVQDDAFGRHGVGEIVAKLRAANGLIIADPVHNWSPSASSRLFFERCYPFVWSGGLRGMPAASISCASNQGMHLGATRDICKWMFGLRTWYRGGLAVHVSMLSEGIEHARGLGHALGSGAVTDATKGRNNWSDADCFVHYAEHAPWSALEPYIENLTAGTMLPQKSLMRAAMAAQTFRKQEAVADLESAQEEFERTITLYHVGRPVDASRALAKAAAYWTRATWREFLEDDVIGVPQPETYQPIPEDEEAAEPE